MICGPWIVSTSSRKQGPSPISRTFLTAPAATSARRVFLSMVLDRDPQFLAARPDQHLDQVGDAPVLLRGRLAHGLLDRGVDPQVERGILSARHARYIVTHP